MKDYKVKFWLKRSQAKNNGKAPIICRQGYGKSDYKDIPTDSSVLPENWYLDPISKSTSVIGCAEADRINKNLQKMSTDLHAIEEKLRVNSMPVNGEIIKSAYEKNGDFQKLTIIDIILRHNTKYLKTVEDEEKKEKRLRKKGFSRSTYNKYVRLKDRLIEFMQAVYKRSDKYLHELNFKFAEDLYDYLVSKEMKNESIRSLYFAKLEKIISNSVKRGEIKGYPFGDFSIERDDVVQKDKLNYQEVLKIKAHRFHKSIRLERIRHRTLITLFTGLSYIDLEELYEHHFFKDINGNRYISKDREKTGIDSIIPVYPMIEDIIDEYLESASERGGKLLPRLSNRVFGDYLDEMLDIIGITGKNITPHALRSSFAQMQLDAGTSLEATAKMLGHADTKELLKHYGKLSKATVMNYKNNLEDSFKKLEDQEVKQAN